ncbi:hypothetical protein [Psychrobacter celer]
MNISNTKKNVRVCFLVLLTGLPVSACSFEPTDKVSPTEQIDISKAYQLGLNYYKGN